MKARKILECVFLVFVFAILSGCAANQIIKNAKIGNPGSEEVNLLLEPVDTVGLLETPYLCQGKTRFYEVVFPELLFLGEIYPGRIKWYGWAVDSGDNEYLVQLLWIYRIRLSGKLIGVVSIEGYEGNIGGKLIGLSSRKSYAYSLDEKEKEVPISWDKFGKGFEYRKKIVEEVGIEIATLKKADYMLPLIQNWNRVEGPRGVIITPLNEEKFKSIARINPAYSYSQKWIKNNPGSISLDPIATGMGELFALIEAAGAQSDGWDFEHKENSRMMALKAKHLIDVKFSAIKEILERTKRR